MILGGVMALIRSIPFHDWIGYTAIVLGLTFITVPKALPLCKRGPAVARAGKKREGVLVPSIEGFALGDYTPPNATMPKVTILDFVATIRNSGPPTIVDNYRLVLRLANGIAIEAKSWEIPTHLNYTYVNTGESEIVYGRDALNRKTMQPIPTGSACQGRMLYVFDNLTEEFFRGHGQRLEFSFKDVFGNEYMVTRDLTEGPYTRAEIMGHAGLTPPTKVERPKTNPSSSATPPSSTLDTEASPPSPASGECP